MKFRTRMAMTVGCSLMLVSAPVGCGKQAPLASIDHLEEIDDRMVTIETESSATETSPFHEVRVPSDKPDDVPIHPNATPTFVFGNELTTIRLESSDPSVDVQGFYASELRRHGWRLVNEGQGNIQGRKSHKRLVNIDLIQDGNVLVVSVQYN